MPGILRTGGCACGQLSFMTHGEPLRIGICHCMTCRKTSGSVFGVFAIFPHGRVTLEGAYVSWQSSPDDRRCFCPVCGSQVFEISGREIEVKAGAFDEPDAVAPTYETWTIRREAWLRMTEMEQYPRNRGDGPERDRTRP